MEKHIACKKWGKKAYLFLVCFVCQITLLVSVVEVSSMDAKQFTGYVFQTNKRSKELLQLPKTLLGKKGEVM